MTIIEYLDNFIKENYTSHLEREKDNIINYLKTHKDKVVIEYKKYNYDDYDRFLENKEEIDKEKLVTVDDEKITIRDINKDFINLIIQYLSRDIISLQTPVEIFNKLKINEFKNLENLGFTEKSRITKDFINKLKGFTNIKELHGNFEYDNDLENDGILIKGNLFEKMLFYKDVVMKPVNFNFDSSASLYCKNPYSNMDKIVELLDLDSNRLNDIRFYLNSNTKLRDHVIAYTKENNYQNKTEFKTINFKNFNNISEIINTLNLFKSKKVPIDKVKIDLENKNYEDIYLIKQIEKEYDCSIRYKGYGWPINVTLDEFITMRETLNYYKSLILEANLSDLEKVTFAYDIIKSFKYNESEESKSDSRNIHKIIVDGKIVCVGYSQFLYQLLKEVGIECHPISTSVLGNDDKRHGHERDLIYVKDDKYNIEGVYALDATWDSAHNIVKVINSDGEEKIKMIDKKTDDEEIIKYYDNLSLYTYFLIPMSKYQEVFTGESMPPLEPGNFAGNTIDLSTFEKLLTNVRLKEGYPKEMIEDNIKDVIELYEYKYNKENKDVIIKR